MGLNIRRMQILKYLRRGQPERDDICLGTYLVKSLYYFSSLQSIKGQ